MEKITGKNNDLIKNVKKLLSSSKQRREQGLFVLEGARLVFDVLNSLYTVKYFLITDTALEKFKLRAAEMINVSESTYIISDELAQKRSDTKTSQGVFAVCYMKSADDFILNKNGRLIALDNLQDPGNLGTTVRTAEALGIDGIIVGGGCDIYNPKALSELTALKSKGYTVYGTSPDSSAVPINKMEFSYSSVCVIGNEANGMSDEVKDICDVFITIPMLGRAESLNAAAAASITMWEMLR